MLGNVSVFKIYYINFSLTGSQEKEQFCSVVINVYCSLLMLTKCFCVPVVIVIVL